MRNWLRKTIFVVSSGLSGLFCIAYYVSYRNWQSCFNEAGRCFDGDVGNVYLEQSGIAWLSLAVLAFGIALYQLWRLTR